MRKEKITLGFWNAAFFAIFSEDLKRAAKPKSRELILRTQTQLQL